MILSLVCDVVDTLQPGNCLVASLAGLREPDILLTFTISKKSFCMYLIECFHFGRITNQATATKSFSSTSFSKSRSFTSSITAWQCLLFCIRACDCAEGSEDKRTIVIIKILILNIGPLIKKHITISQYLLGSESKRAN